MSDAIDALPPLRDVIAAAGLDARKALGQNFLCDLNITDKIARRAGDLGAGTTCEIGPGPGGLTRSLLRAGAQHVVAVEYDPRAVAALQSLQEAAAGRLDVVRADALEIDLLDLAPRPPRRIVANLPYNVATPLLIGWLRQIRTHPGAWQSLTLMFQREVAARLAASPGSSAYGRLTVMTRWLCDVALCFDLPPQVFLPPPKVVSTVVHLVPYPARTDAPPFAAMESLTARAFGQRRKMLRSSLRGYEEIMQQSSIDPTRRAQDLTVDEFVRMARLLPPSGPEREGASDTKDDAENRSQSKNPSQGESR